VVTIKDWKVKIRNNKLASKERFFWKPIFFSEV
jgi:hypothetical protein